MENGLLAGYPLIDVKARLVDGSYHDVDSNEMAFKIAASMALKKAKTVCNPVILEPMMKVEVVVPEEYMGDIMGDVTCRRGRVEGMDCSRKRSSYQCICSTFRNVWLCNYTSFTYSRPWYLHYELRSLREVPKSISEEIIKKATGE